MQRLRARCPRSTPRRSTRNLRPHGRRRSLPTCWTACTGTGWRRTISPSDRSFFRTIRCSASRFAPEHIKPRLLGHWGTSPGLSLLYVHLNRLIVERDASTSSISPAQDMAVRRSSPTCTSRARTREVYPDITRDTAGLRATLSTVLDSGRHPESRQRADARLDSRRRRARLRAVARVRRGVRQSRISSSPPSSATAKPRPRRSRARGRARAFSIPRATARCCRSSISTATRSADRRCSLARATTTSSDVLEGHGYEVHDVAGDDPMVVHQALAAALDAACDRIRAIQARRASDRRRERHASDRGGPRSSSARRKAGRVRRIVDGHPVEGTFRVAPGPAASSARTTPPSSRCSRRGSAAISPRRCSTSAARSSHDLASLAPSGDRRMGANPHANGGRAARAARPPRLPRLRGRRSRSPATVARESTRQLGAHAARRLRAQRRGRATSGSSVPTRRTRIGCRAVFDVENRCLVGRRSADRRSRRARRPRDGGAERASLRGLARGLPAHRPPRHVRDVRVVRDGLGVDDRAAHQVARGGDRRCRGARRSRRSTCCSRRPAGATITTASATRARD